MTPLRYLFLRLVMQRIRVSPQLYPVPLPLAATVLLAGINLMTAALFVRHWWNWGRLVQGGSDVRLELSFALVVGVGALQYYLWVADGRLETLLVGLAAQTPHEYRTRNASMWAYVLVSVGALFGAVFLLVHSAAT